MSYDYTAELMPDGNLLLRGVYLDTTERFKFTVTPAGWVSGYVDERRVRFAVGKDAFDRAVAGLQAPGAVIAERSGR